jgi:hypothetical protein
MQAATRNTAHNCKLHSHFLEFSPDSLKKTPGSPTSGAPQEMAGFKLLSFLEGGTALESGRRDTRDLSSEKILTFRFSAYASDLERFD